MLLVTVWLAMVALPSTSILTLKLFSLLMMLIILYYGVGSEKHWITKNVITWNNMSENMRIDNCRKKLYTRK